MNTVEIDMKVQTISARLWRKLALMYSPKDRMDMIMNDKYGMQRIVQYGREREFDFKIVNEHKHLIFLLVWGDCILR